MMLQLKLHLTKWQVLSKSKLLQIHERARPANDTECTRYEDIGPYNSLPMQALLSTNFEQARLRNIIFVRENDFGLLTSLLPFLPCTVILLACCPQRGLHLIIAATRRDISRHAGKISLNLL